MDLLFYTFTVFLFAAVILLIEGVYLWWSSTHGKAAQRIARRLQVMSGGIGRSGERISILKQRRFSAHDGFDRLLHRITPLQRIDALLVQAGSTLTVERFLGCSLVAFLLVLVVSMRWPLPLGLRLLLLVPALAIPYVLARRARTRRLGRIEHQLPDAADFIARALRAGHSFTNVLQIVGNELPEPLSSEFRIAREEINYGVPMAEALHNMAARIPLTDLRYLIIAVLIQRESGGNLAEILGNISTIIRSRLRLVAQVRVLSAEGRMSAWILGLLPFGVMLVLTLINPDYVSLLWTDPSGVRLLWYAAGMILFGVVWLRKVIRIRI
ncbi:MULTISPECIES: type II secretion system F family protein [unclassified Massilia]|uniref:type II secretion system F family protein n=1 Tax=unclassified Massilia TaxID=2609279 RepID=UPI00177D4AC1|nr:MULTISPECIES: type II secretion system F family protein [unclassified Massilia]MBD8533243.1 type II secretion system F family protein [Massilia sp. CFBP 13647]MBD8674450.1 type II secretion system F family protein [Massilia sp. CFBP 13721]